MGCFTERMKATNLRTKRTCSNTRFLLLTKITIFPSFFFFIYIIMLLLKRLKMSNDSEHDICRSLIARNQIVREKHSHLYI